MNIDVSIVVPNYNHAKFLRDRMDSILYQSYQNFEIVILDDFSLDNSREIILAYKDHPKVSKIILNKANVGNTFKQWKKGVAESAGKFIWICESDDFCDENLLLQLVTMLHKNEMLGLAFCQSNKINDLGEILGDYSSELERSISSVNWRNDFQMNGQEFSKLCLNKISPIPNVSAVVFRKEALQSALNEPLELKVSGDWLTYLRICKNYDIGYNAAKLNSHRNHENTVRFSTKGFQSLSDHVSFLKEQNKILKFNRNDLHEMINKILFNLIYGNVCKQLVTPNEFFKLMLRLEKIYHRTPTLFYKMCLKDKFLLHRMFHGKRTFK